MSPCIIFTYHSDFVWRLKVTRDIHHKSSRRERGRHIQDCELNILIFGILRASFNITFLEYRLSRSRDDRSRWEWAWRHSPHKCHRVFNNGDHIRTLEIFMENFIKFVSSFYYSKTPLKCKTTTLRNRVGQQVKSTSTDFIAQALTTSSKVSAASKNLIQVENLVQILPVHFMSWFRLDHKDLVTVVHSQPGPCSHCSQYRCLGSLIPILGPLFHFSWIFSYLAIPPITFENNEMFSIWIASDASTKYAPWSRSPLFLLYLTFSETVSTKIRIHVQLNSLPVYLKIPKFSKNFNHLDSSRAPPAWRQTSNLSAKLTHYLKNTDCYYSKFSKV